MICGTICLPREWNQIGLFVLLGWDQTPASSLTWHMDHWSSNFTCSSNKALDKKFELPEPQFIYLLSGYTNAYFIGLSYSCRIVKGNATLIAHFHNYSWHYQPFHYPVLSHLSFSFHLSNSLWRPQDISSHLWPVASSWDPYQFMTGLCLFYSLSLQSYLCPVASKSLCNVRAGVLKMRVTQRLWSLSLTSWMPTESPAASPIRGLLGHTCVDWNLVRHCG